MPNAPLVLNAEPIAPEVLAVMDLSALADEYKRVLGDIDQIKAAESRARGLRDAVREVIIERMKSQGIDKMSHAGLSLSVRKEPFVKLEDVDWDTLLGTLAGSHHGYIVQRRLTVKKLQEAVDQGMRLPDGVTIGTKDSLAHRRNPGQ